MKSGTKVIAILVDKFEAMRKNWFVLVLFLVGCSVPEKQAESNDQSVEYAKAFHFENENNGKILVVDEPWPNAQTNKRYQLNKPLSKVVVTSTSHLPYFEMLGRADAVIGFPNVNYISSEIFRQRAADGLITDLGPDGNINMELLLAIQPDAVIAFDMGGESATLDKIEEAGIPVYFNSDFLESTPLGRAEWIKFFGALIGEEEKADSIFTDISNEYNRLVGLTKNVQQKPIVLNGVVYGDTWFMPGGGNWAAEFYENAGGEYLYSNDTTYGWLELSFEAVFDKGRIADYWIGTSSFNSKAEMLDSEPRYADFEPFRNDRVYNYSKRRNPTGGYDFFESGYARPDFVLSDLIKILHPQLLPKYETYYFEKLK